MSIEPIEAAQGQLRGSSGAAQGQMVRFILRDGMTLEIHIPEAVSAQMAESKARTAGSILRREGRVVNVGVLSQIVRP